MNTRPHFLLSFVFTLGFATPLFAQRGLTEIPDPDPAKEKASFRVAEGYEVNLFAAEPKIAKPIQMNWDSQGRLWVATSETYPHVKPGQDANDKIYLLEDTDNDGVADRSTIFADGLLMPTAILPGDGGVYVANSTELLHLKDLDGDRQADERRIVLSGFGTEDTHHIIHTLKRGPAGDIYFNQSIYTHSHVETPDGVKRLLAGGTWKFDSETLELDVFSRGLINPWGLEFDSWGQSFETDGAGGEGLNYVFPGTVMRTAHNAERIVPGLSPGQPKHCGLELLTGDHLPGDWSGRYVTNDFRGNRINSFRLSESGSGYVAEQTDDLLTSDYVAFRPVDINMGPDGAIYVADWYNPIIQHGEVDFRDDRRDHEHGRIWRIAPKQIRSSSPLPTEQSLEELVTSLQSDFKWLRDEARYELSKQDNRKAIFAEINQHIANTDDAFAKSQLLLSRLWLAEDFHQPEQVLKYGDELLGHEDHRVRAAATRAVGHFTEQPGALALLERAVKDSHPQVRLEAVSGLRNFDSLAAVSLITTAIRPDLDRFLDFALWQAIRESESIWIDEFVANPEWLAHDPAKIFFVAAAARTPRVIDPILQQVEQGQIAEQYAGNIHNLIAERGTPHHLNELWKQAQEMSGAKVVPLLQTFIQAAERRRVKPTDSLNELASLLRSENGQVQQLACRLAGLWRLSESREALEEIVSRAETPRNLRNTAMTSLAQLGGAASRDFLVPIARGKKHPELQVAAIEALAKMNLSLAAEAAVQALSEENSAEKVDALLDPLLSNKRGPAVLKQTLQQANWSASVATAAVRRASRLPQPHPGLLEAIRNAGKIKAMNAEMSPREMVSLVKEIQQQGNIQRGQMIYRREDLLCTKCHAIGGAGGKVGPDLSSIGASAPVDYLVESLTKPNKKIKEGYHSVQVVTADGLVVTGVPVIENQKEIKLRNADGEVLTIATDEIELKQNSEVSLMPADLVKKLRRDELVDLVRFLSSLGKTGETVVSKQQYVRTWQVLDPGDKLRAINDAIRHNGVQHAATDDPLLTWKTVYSLVDGSLPLQPLAWMGNISGKNLQFARFELEVIQAGEIGLKIENPAGLRLWIDEREVAVSQEVGVQLEPGLHRVTIASDSQARKMAPLQLELINLDDSSGQAKLVN